MKIRKQRLPSSGIKKYGPPYFRCKNMVCGQNMVPYLTCPLFLIKQFHFSLPKYFGYMLCLPVFPVSEIDNPLCLVCVQ